MSEDFPRIPPRTPYYYELPEHIPPRKPGTEYPLLHLNSHIFEPLLPVPTTYMPLIPFVVHWNEKSDRVLRHLMDTELICQCWFHNEPEADHYVYRVQVIGVAVLNRFQNTTILVARLQTIPDPRSDGLSVPGLGPSPLRNAYEALVQQHTLHQPYPGGWDFEHETPIDYCYLCGQPWPCETEKARHV